MSETTESKPEPEHKSAKEVGLDAAHKIQYVMVHAGDHEPNACLTCYSYLGAILGILAAGGSYFLHNYGVAETCADLCIYYTDDWRLAHCLNPPVQKINFGQVGSGSPQWLESAIGLSVAAMAFDDGVITTMATDGVADKCFVYGAPYYGGGDDYGAAMFQCNSVASNSFPDVSVILLETPGLSTTTTTTATSGGQTGNMFGFRVALAKAAAAGQAYISSPSYGSSRAGKVSWLDPFGTAASCFSELLCLYVDPANSVQASDTHSGDNFGFSLSTDVMAEISSVLVVTGLDLTGSQAASSYIFDIASDFSLTERTVGTPSDFTSSDPNSLYGWSSAVAGDLMVVGAPLDSGRGAIYLYDLTTNSLISVVNGQIADEGFGASVALFVDVDSPSGTGTLVVGAPGAYCVNPADFFSADTSYSLDVGNKVYIYSIADGVATLISTNSPASAQSGDCFGASVTMNRFGTAVIVGSPMADGATGDVHEFDVDPFDNTLWEEVEGDVFPTEQGDNTYSAPGSLMGYAIMHDSDNRIAIGVPKMFDRIDGVTTLGAGLGFVIWTQEDIVAGRVAEGGCTVE